jgi:hypothetical protein
VSPFEEISIVARRSKDQVLTTGGKRVKDTGPGLDLVSIYREIRAEAEVVRIVRASLDDVLNST